MNDWSQYFPVGFTPRQQQIDALNFAFDKFQAGQKHVLLELGTGVGKSAIAVALARRMAEPAYVLTSQKVLQDQYMRDFSDYIVDLRSSSNFACSYSGTCAGTMRIKRALEGLPAAKKITCAGTLSCPYAECKEKFKNSPIGITNYSYYLSETIYAGGLKPRSLLVLDEAHNIENEVRRWATIAVSKQWCKTELKLSIPSDAKDVPAWIVSTYAPALGSLKSQLATKIERAVSNQSDPSALSEKFEFVDKHLCQVNRYIEEYGGSKDDYVVSIEDTKDDTTINLKPIFISKQAKLYLYDSADHVLMMSATILSKDVYARNNGLPKSAAFMSRPSPFPHEAYGITYSPIAKMNAARKPSDVSRVVAEIVKILAKHPNDKGIIHTGSYEITREIESINDPRLLIQKSYADRESILTKHMTDSNPTVLVSPGMTEGLDLHGELGRFQVICKVPFPYLGDPVVQRIKEKDHEWYAWVTARTVVQATGRCVRSSDDWAKTYILDGCFGDFFVKWSKFFPDHFSSMEVVG